MSPVPKNERQKFKEQFKQIFYDEGYAIAGERLIFRCREISKINLVNDTGRHKASEGKLIGTAMCGVLRRWVSLQGPLSAQTRATDHS